MFAKSHSKQWEVWKDIRKFTRIIRLGQVAIIATTYATTVKKSFKTQCGLTRHINQCKINTVVLSEEDFIGIILQLIIKTKENKYDCYPDSIARCIKSYTNSAIEQLLVDLKPIVDEFMKKLRINKFQRLYYAKIVLNAETYFTNLNKPICTLFAKTLRDKILCHFSKDEPIQSAKPISEREMGGCNTLQVM